MCSNPPSYILASDQCYRNVIQLKNDLTFDHDPQNVTGNLKDDFKSQCSKPTTVHFLKKRFLVSFLTFTASQPKLMCLLTIQCENIFYSRQINKTFICYQKHLERCLLSGFSLPCFPLLHWERGLCYQCNYLCVTLEDLSLLSM